MSGQRNDSSHTSCSSRSSTGPSEHAYKHLIIEANGLYGHPGNWAVVNECLRDTLDGSHYLIHPSLANQYALTFQGVDACGERLAAEIAEVARKHPGLRYISMIGHSMGGLMLRYAAGKLYDPETRAVAGLEPIHYISMATPHLGCDTSGESQVPFIGWLRMQAVARLVVKPVTTVFFKKTGQQLFMHDGETQQQQQQQQQRQASRQRSRGRAAIEDPEAVRTDNGSGFSSLPPNSAPVLLRMTCDTDGDAHYRSALAAFKSRTAYANAGHDHLVGWGNSSLRFKHELPDLRLHDRKVMPRALGVVRDDGPNAALCEPLASLSESRLGPSAARSASGNSAAPQAGLAGGWPRSFKVTEDEEALESEGAGSAGMAAVAVQDQVGMRGGASAATGAKGNGNAAEVHAPAASDSDGASDVDDGLQALVRNGSDRVSQALDHPAADSLPLDSSLTVVRSRDKTEQTAHMLHVLQSMPWSRVDCSWRDARVSAFAHNHIQVTRVWQNSEGKSVCRHLANRFATLEERVAAARPDYESAATLAHSDK